MGWSGKSLSDLQTCNNAIDAYVRAAELNPNNPAITQQKQRLRNAQVNDVPEDAVSGPGSHDNFDSDFQTTTTHPEADAENCDVSRYTDSGNSVHTLLPRLVPYWLISLWSRWMLGKAVSSPVPVNSTCYTQKWLKFTGTKYDVC